MGARDLHFCLVGIHLTVLGGFLRIDDTLTWQQFGGGRAMLPVVLLYGGLILTIASVVRSISTGSSDDVTSMFG